MSLYHATPAPLSAVIAHRDETFLVAARSTRMTEQKYSGAEPKMGDLIVNRPRTTDAVGRTLRSVFESTTMPNDMMILIERLDHVQR
jgi:hypothetical protein